MPQGLKRINGTGDLHVIPFSGHHRLPHLASPEPKQTFEAVLEQTRQPHNFDIHSCVLMPEHVHLLLSEPTEADLATTLRVLKPQTARLLKGSRETFWQPRYDDFNVYTENKRLEKLRYIYRNPVTRGLAKSPAHYPWSSAPHLRHRHALPHTHRLSPDHPRTTRAKPKPGAPPMAASPPTTA